MRACAEPLPRDRHRGLKRERGAPRLPRCFVRASDLGDPLARDAAEREERGHDRGRSASPLGEITHVARAVGVSGRCEVVRRSVASVFVIPYPGGEGCPTYPRRPRRSRSRSRARRSPRSRRRVALRLLRVAHGGRRSRRAVPRLARRPLPASPLGLRDQGEGGLPVRRSRGDHQAGDAYYVPPGHTPVHYAGTEIVEFSPTVLGETIPVVMKNLQSAEVAAGSPEPATWFRLSSVVATGSQV